jgi:hypothetical protein
MDETETLASRNAACCGCAGSFPPRALDLIEMESHLNSRQAPTSRKMSAPEGVHYLRRITLPRDLLILRPLAIDDEAMR